MSIVVIALVQPSTFVKIIDVFLTIRHEKVCWPEKDKSLCFGEHQTLVVLSGLISFI